MPIVEKNVCLYVFLLNTAWLARFRDIPIGMFLCKNILGNVSFLCNTMKGIAESNDFANASICEN